ncbi:MAG: excisionase family DNA-binding protein [Clostridia bacterium]|nr:excisionase family DNA-binding protein [Clostridia bacterium]
MEHTARRICKTVTGIDSARIETPFCTISEAAKRSGLAQGYIRQLARRGEIPMVRVGRIYRINYDKFMEQMAAQSMTANR